MHWTMDVIICNLQPIFRRNATHCISPYAIVVCVCVCVCVPRLWTSEKQFEIETPFFLKLLGMTPDISKTFTQIG